MNTYSYEVYFQGGNKKSDKIKAIDIEEAMIAVSNKQKLNADIITRINLELLQRGV